MCNRERHRKAHRNMAYVGLPPHTVATATLTVADSRLNSNAQNSAEGHSLQWMATTVLGFSTKLSLAQPSTKPLHRTAALSAYRWAHSHGWLLP
jgi:hypothetical protein